MSIPGTFERERRRIVGEFVIYVDRKAAAFVSMSAGLSHKGGCTTHIMSPAAAEALGRALVEAAQFGAVPMMSDSPARASQLDTK